MQNIMILFLNKEVYRDMLTDDEYNGVMFGYKRFIAGVDHSPILDVIGESGTATFDMRQIVGIIAVNKK